MQNPIFLLKSEILTVNSLFLRMRNFYFTLINILLVLQLSGQIFSLPNGENLRNIENKQIGFKQFTKNQAVAIVLFSSDCPLSQKYASILRGYSEQYPTVKFIAVFSKWDSKEAIEVFLKEYPLSMTAFQDPKNRFIHQLDAEATPEVFLFDKKHVLKYRGAIDNWFYALGKYRPEPTECYLENAINDYLNNKEIKLKKTNAIGCIIEK